MKRINQNTILGILITANIVLGNVGGVFTNPSIIGKPVTYELTDISIDSEHIYISLYEENNEIRGTFKSEYFLSREIPGDTLINGLFYGIRADSVKVYKNSDLINQEVDSATTKILDSLFLITPSRANGRIYHDYFLRNDPLSRFGYKYIFKNGEKNVLTVTGKLSPADMQLWGLAVLFTFPFYKHPWLNGSALPQGTQISYLISPITTWKKVGKIAFNVDYPKSWKTEIIGYRDSEKWGKLDTLAPDKKSQSDGKTYISLTLPDNKIAFLVFSIDRPRTTIYPGGPYLALGGSKSHGFLCNVSWDFAAKIGQGTGILGRIGYESNFGNYNAIVPEIQVNSIYFWLLGAKAGLPYNLNKKELSIRAGFAIDLMILGITFNWDYLTQDKKWINSVLGTITF
jgi:hypothetical protein